MRPAVVEREGERIDKASRINTIFSSDHAYELLYVQMDGILIRRPIIRGRMLQSSGSVFKLWQRHLAKLPRFHVAINPVVVYLRAHNSRKGILREDTEADQQPPSLSDVSDAKDGALRLLSQRSHSRKELVDKLNEKGYHPEAVAHALDRLSTIGLQSDTEFAEVFARSKWRQSKWAASRIILELKRRGISNDQAKDAVDVLFGVEGLNVRGHLEAIEDDESLPLGETPEAFLVEDARKRWNDLLGGFPVEVRRRRLISYYQRRGHSWETISKLMKHIEKRGL